MNVALIGGGRAAVILLDFFSALKEAKIVGVSDLNADAPGMLHAQKLGIPTTTRSEELVKRSNAQLIVELTGNSKVQETLAKAVLPGQEIMSSSCAKLMCDMIVAQSGRDAKVAETVSEEFRSSTERLQAAIGNIDLAYKNIETLLREAGLISLNAKIEAARAGDAGAAFGIVVNRLNEMLNDIRDAMEKISNASIEGHETLACLQSAKDRLANEFQLLKRP